MPKILHSPEKESEVIALIAGGSPVAEACRIAGIGRETFYRWQRKHPDFRAKVERADAERQRRLRHQIETMGMGKEDWRAPAWLLERTSPDYREKKELSVHVEKAVEDLLDALQGELTEGAYAELVTAIARLQGVDAAEAAVHAEAGSAGPLLSATAGSNTE